ncbi:MAG: hypothetical protein ACJ762_12280 [Solirubrobacteraceae bacterium]
MPRRRLLAPLAAVMLAGCGSEPASFELPAGARPIGAGARFQPALADVAVPGCRRGPLGERHGAHLELFGDGKVVLFARGIGTRGPRETIGGRISGARCFGPVVTIDPTGLVLLRPGTRATVGDVFALWGQPLSRRRAASFRGAVRVYVNGRRVGGPPQDIPLGVHDQIVLQVGEYVPPHASYYFPGPY